MNSNWSFQTVIINVPAVSKYFVNVPTQRETLRKKETYSNIWNPWIEITFIGWLPLNLEQSKEVDLRHAQV